MLAVAFNRIAHLDRLEASRRPAHGTAIADPHGVIYHADAGFESALRAEWRRVLEDADSAWMIPYFLRVEMRDNDIRSIRDHVRRRGVGHVDQRGHRLEGGRQHGRDRS